MENQSIYFNTLLQAVSWTFSEWHDYQFIIPGIHHNFAYTRLQQKTNVYQYNCKLCRLLFNGSIDPTVSFSNCRRWEYYSVKSSTIYITSTALVINFNICHWESILQKLFIVSHLTKENLNRFQLEKDD